MDDLDRLPRMSPVEEPIISPTEGLGRRRSRMVIRLATILSGIALILVCGWFLFIAVAERLVLIDPTLEGPAYLAEVSKRLSGPQLWGLLSGPPSLGLTLGFVLVGLGLIKRKKSVG
jgi:hypothetical protein